MPLGFSELQQHQYRVLHDMTVCGQTKDTNTQQPWKYTRLQCTIQYKTIT